jgi:hypothetical protein
LSQGSVYYGSVEWANAELSFAIQTLQGKQETSSWKHRLQTALVIKDLLEEYGYHWQVWVLECWIHRLQPRVEAGQ